MCKILLFAFMLCLKFSSVSAQEAAQSLPATCSITPYRLQVGYNVNTAIAFPTAIKKAYWGYNDIMGIQVPNLDNIILIKAARKDFEPTNLHVFTSDGRLFVFQVTYSDQPVSTTFDLRRGSSDSAFSSANDLIYSDEHMNPVLVGKMIEKVKSSQRFFRRTGNKYGMRLQLDGIYSKGPLLFFSFRLSNLSRLDYDVDFTHLYIKDKHRSKRSTFQQRELLHSYRDTLKTIWGLTTKSFVLVVPRFTIPDGKEFFFEMYEQNGGRNLTMRIKNRHLLNAKPL